jgi:type I site-specific restriction-modification system R (restriction) subunit
MIELIGNKKEQKIYANEFKDPNSDFKIAIVVDM